MNFTGRSRRLSDEEICRLYAEGIDSETIAYQARCSGTTVLTIVRRNGGEIGPRGGKRKTLPLDDAEICRLYQTGVSGIKIAKAAGTHPVNIYKVLDKHNIERRTKWQHLKKTKTKS